MLVYMPLRNTRKRGMPVHQCISHNMKDLSVSNIYLAPRHISGNGKVSLLTNCWRKVNEPKYNQIGEAGERSKTQPSTKQSSSGNSGAFAPLSPVEDYNDDFTQSFF